ncbi:hypothetical protein SAMN05428964_11128 [Thalassospira xiamenensis]|uniref:Uncharacterized protein n=1 Tax=Thalassospira xiamenensis TaxID=220697 RepID=A0A285TYL3_9PROT|nr:hypothetical protein SAMN05428964_11128 [Thalassospira xiamenensis]
MTGYSYNEPEPVEVCPYCGSECRAEFMSVGVGMVQAGPYHCESCGASEIGPHDKPRPLSEEEQNYQWYAPNSEPGSSANVICGKVVSSREMKNVYRMTFRGNSNWCKPGVVDNWFREIRKKSPSFS